MIRHARSALLVGVTRVHRHQHGQVGRAEGHWRDAAPRRRQTVRASEEVAELLAFCASDKASYLTGIDIPCDGGVTGSVTLRDKLSIARKPS